MPTTFLVLDYDPILTPQCSFSAPFEVTWYSASKSVSYLHNDVGPLENILKESNRFVWTKPKELFRSTTLLYRVWRSFPLFVGNQPSRLSLGLLCASPVSNYL